MRPSRWTKLPQIGPGGSFLMSELTLQTFRQAYFQSGIFANLTLEEWQAQGQPKAEAVLRDHTRQLLDDSQPPEDHGELLARGEAFIHEPPV